MPVHIRQGNLILTLLVPRPMQCGMKRRTDYWNFRPFPCWLDCNRFDRCKLFRQNLWHGASRWPREAAAE